MNALQNINQWIKREDHDDGEDYFIVTDGCIEIMDEYGDSGTIYADKAITEILQNAPTGEAMKFDRLAIKCTCGQCGDTLLVYDDGEVAIENMSKGWFYSTQIDPRYCSAIYRHMESKQIMSDDYANELRIAMDAMKHAA